MPVTNSAASAQTGSADPQLFKFEVSSPKLFHLLLTTSLHQVHVDIGVGKLGGQVNVPVPGLVQKAALTGYQWVAPYVIYLHDQVVAGAWFGKKTSQPAVHAKSK